MLYPSSVIPADHRTIPVPHRYWLRWYQNRELITDLLKGVLLADLDHSVPRNIKYVERTARKTGVPSKTIESLECDKDPIHEEAQLLRLVLAHLLVRASAVVPYCFEFSPSHLRADHGAWRNSGPVAVVDTLMAGSPPHRAGRRCSSDRLHQGMVDRSGVVQVVETGWRRGLGSHILVISDNAKA